MSIERLDKFLSSQTSISRNEIKTSIYKNQVTINGEIIKDTSRKVNPETDIIMLNGQQILYKKNLYIMLNKPKNTVSATKDNKDKTVIDIIPKNLYRKNLFPVGRLDKDTEGLLIITDDGEFSHRITSPKKEIYKVYEATINRKLTNSDIENFSNGIIFLDGTKCLPAKLEIISDYKALVTICEGKFHQVKKMFSVINAQICELKRIKIGNLSLDENLQVGQSRELTPQEIKSIFD